jgi:pre-mRNA-splicing factor 38A
MANRTDPLAAQLSGSDPQNLLEYITRQRIYDSRYWKEECFGLTVEDVLEKAVDLGCIGGLPTRFLALTLKLLQLHPEPEVVAEAFVRQDRFKYVRALGCLYVRMTGRPADVYEALEPVYSDHRKLRSWTPPLWSVTTVDGFVHELLRPGSSVLGIALPRLPARGTLQEAGYLPEGPRPTALRDVLEAHGADGDPLEYLKYKALVEKSPAAVAAWKKRQEKEERKASSGTKDLAKAPAVDDASNVVEEEKELAVVQREDEKSRHIKEERRDKKKKRKKERKYDNLFKSGGGSSKAKKVPSSLQEQPVEESTEYWNDQRAKLGLKPLKE